MKIGPQFYLFAILPIYQEFEVFYLRARKYFFSENCWKSFLESKTEKILNATT
jgi:hypothetical protein